MSDENPNESAQSDGSNRSARREDDQDISALIEELSSRKVEFETMLTSARQEFQAEIEKAKIASTEIDGLRGELQSTNAATDSIRAAIEQARENVKAVIAEIEEIRTSVATSKGAIEAFQKTASDDLGIIADAKAQIAVQSSEASSRLGGLSAKHDEIAVQIVQLQDQKASFQGLLADFANAKIAAEADGRAAKDYVEETKGTRDKLIELTSAIQQDYDRLTERQAALKDKVVEIEEANTEILALHHRLLEGSEEEQSLEREIDELHSQISSTLAQVTAEQGAANAQLAGLVQKVELDSKKLESSLNERFDKLHESLQQKILALLPSAGAAGLASTYYDAKSRYSPTSYSGKPGAVPQEGFWKFLRPIASNNPASLFATIFFYALFIVPLALLTYGTYDLVWQLETNKEFVLDYRILLLRFLIAVPLATMSAFGFTSLRLYRKLYEEYNHKQRVMELYRSFRDEIETSGDAEQVKALLAIMLESVASKAWESAEQGSEKDDGNRVFANIDQVVSVFAKLKGLGS